MRDEFYPPFDPSSFYVEDRDNFPGDMIRASSVTYEASSNAAVVMLAEPRDPAIRYQLVIMYHNIQDRAGNRLTDPTIVRVNVPLIFQNGMAGYAGMELIARVPIFLRGGLTIHRNADGSMTLAWTDGTAMLQEAFDVTGPWRDMSGATNSWQSQVSSGKRFYRLRAF